MAPPATAPGDEPVPSPAPPAEPPEPTAPEAAPSEPPAAPPAEAPAEPTPDAAAAPEADPAPAPVDAAPPAEPMPDVATAAAAAPEPPAAAAPAPAAAPGAEVEVGSAAEAAAPEEEEIVVLGSSLPRAAGSAQVLREQQLERFEYDDPTQALMQIPGVYVRQEDGIGLRPNIGMRGVNPNRSAKITLMEDGVLFGPAPYSAPAAYFFPLLTRMTELRVVKGPSAIAYGPQTVAGAIDFVSRPIPSAASGSVDIALGEFGYNKEHAYFGTSNEQFGFLIEGVRLQNTGFAELPNGADTGSTRNEWVAKASYVLDPTATIENAFSVKLQYTDEVSNETYLGQSDEDFREDPYRRYAASALDQMKNHRFSVALTHVADFREDDIKLTTTVYRHDYHRIWRKLNRMGGAAVSEVLADPDSPQNQPYYDVITGAQDTGSPAERLYIGPNDRNFISEGLQTRLSAKAKTGPIVHRIEAGLRLHYDEIRRVHTEDAFDMLDGELVPSGTATLTTTRNWAGTYAAALHATDALEFGSFVLTPGIRTELVYSETEDYLADTEADRFVVALLPGVGAYYGIVPEFGVLAGVYRGFSPPAPGSDDVIDPEYSVNYEGGARYVEGRAHAEAIGFYNDYSNLTDVCTQASGCVDAGLDRQFDAGAAHVYGVELSGGHEVPLPWELELPTSVAYTFTRGEFQSTFQSADPIYGDVVAGDEIPYLPEHQLNVTLGLEHRYAGVNGSLTFVDRMREVAGQGDYIESETTDAQTILDLGAFVRPLAWFTIYANLRNVTGDAYLAGRRPYGARANAPRWFQAGVRAEF